MVRAAQTWMLALLLIIGGLVPARVCTAHPTIAGPDQDTCCKDGQAASPHETTDRNPTERPDEPVGGCDCPWGCCPVKSFHALSVQGTEAGRVMIHSPWLVAADEMVPQVPVQGPRRPPRS